jgi:hypothetical protein
MVGARPGVLIEWVLERHCEIGCGSSARVAVGRVSPVTGIGYDGTRKREIVDHYLI